MSRSVWASEALRLPAKHCSDTFLTLAAKVTSTGDEAEVARALGVAARTWRREVEAFGGEISMSKSVALVGSASLRRRLALECD